MVVGGGQIAIVCNAAPHVKIELVPSAETRGPKRHKYNSPKILPDGRKPERRNDDCAEKEPPIPLQITVY